ncbi:PDDEXK nuclease domain-containing protein [Flavobacterium sp.]|uniref:PDDEXK nuclease domain-containing protein n=1 Tax=Flavobacterium sp. TaxID=239 RepID=UPI003B9CDCD8
MKNLSQLISIINDVHSELQASAVNAVNKALTIRNWLIGYYIVEYEQNGEDRAEYGAKLLPNLAVKLEHIKGIDERSLRSMRKFYQSYTYLDEIIWGTVTPKFQTSLIRGTASPKFTEEQASALKMRSLTPLSEEKLKVPANVLISKLSYSHLELLLNITQPLKRTFYEIECIKGTWSVRELKRQIASLYFERSGLSQNPEKLAELVQQKTKPQLPRDIIKNIYAFEFLDIGIKPIVEESDLETALLNNLQQFIIELGNGFCLEARQKRILIGETYYFVDLVFYHRILKCHILVDLKVGAFDHGDIGQLNTYLNLFKAEITETTDNPPVGILLVAEKDHALVKYATAGMDENLFVQQYLVKLPSQEQLVNHLETELKHFRNE